MSARASWITLVGIAMAACAAPPPQVDPAYSEVVVVPDRPDNPTVVRFVVPTALVMGMPGEHVPNTLHARIATRDIALRALASKGYCRNGFTGPDELVFPDGDRSRTAFTVRCIG